jgi:hypothetical protein
LKVKIEIIGHVVIIEPNENYTLIRSFACEANLLNCILRRLRLSGKKKQKGYARLPYAGDDFFLEVFGTTWDVTKVYPASESKRTLNLLFYQENYILILPTITDENIVWRIVRGHASFLLFHQAIKREFIDENCICDTLSIGDSGVIAAIFAIYEKLHERIAEEVDLLGEEAREVVFLNGIIGLDVQYLLRRLLRGEKRCREIDDLEPSACRLAHATIQPPRNRMRDTLVLPGGEYYDILLAHESNIL